MDLQSLMGEDPASGFPQIIGQILSNLDFESLIACRAVNRTWKNFLEEKSQRFIWISAIDKDRKKYLDKHVNPELSMENPISEEERKAHYEEWMKVLETVKEIATIRQMIIICPLMKETKETIESFCSFSPRGMLLSFYASSDCSLPDLPFDTEIAIEMNCFKTFIDLGLAEEKSLTRENWDVIVESVLQSNHAEAVKFFVSKLMAVNPLEVVRDIRYFDKEEESHTLSGSGTSSEDNE